MDQRVERSSLTFERRQELRQQVSERTAAKLREQRSGERKDLMLLGRQFREEDARR